MTPVPYKDPAKHRKCAREYYRNRRKTDPEYAEKLRAYYRARYAADVEASRAYQNEYRQRNLAKKRAAERAWRATNPARLLAANRRFRGIPLPTRPAPPACECCGKKETARRNKELSIDHCHVTGSFRGWLCSRCNTGIGMLGDNLTGAESAVAYLKRSVK